MHQEESEAYWFAENQLITEGKLLAWNEEIYNQNTTVRLNGYQTQTPSTNLTSKSNKMAEVEKTWNDEQLHSEEVSKKDIIKFLHEHASFEV